MHIKKLLIAVALTGTIASHAVADLTSDQLARIPQQLSSADPKVRMAAVEELESGNPATAGNGVLPALCKALADPEKGVRAGAAASLAMIAMSSSPKIPHGVKASADLRSYAPLQPALVAAINDPDEETRKNALAAYLLAFEMSPWLQEALIIKYGAERPGSVFKPAILEALTFDGAPSPAAKQFLVQVAKSPTDSTILARAIVDSKAPPSEVLPHLADQFAAAKDGPKKALFARAIGKFGASAEQYVPVLEKAAADEPDSATKESITKVATALRNSH